MLKQCESCNKGIGNKLKIYWNTRKNLKKLEKKVNKKRMKKNLRETYFRNSIIKKN